MEITNTLRHVYTDCDNIKNEKLLREKLQIEINSAFCTQQHLFSQQLNTRQKITAYRQELRSLENRNTLCDVCLFEATPLTDFFMNICYACDLALAGTGKRVIFSGSADSAFICREAVTRQTLNLISNAAIHSSSPVINASLKSAEQTAFFSVYNSGNADLPTVEKAFRKTGSGLWYTAKVSQLHGTTALFCCSEKFVKTSIGFKTSAVKTHKPVEDFTSLLCNRLSPVYTQLSTVDGI